MENNISIVGIGKLGLCFALTLERAGYNVVGVDINRDYVDLVNKRELRSDEPGVEKYLKEAKNLVATTKLSSALDHSNVIYVVVATPSLPNGRYNHTQIENLADNLITHGVQKDKKHLIICCTTMPEYCDSLQEKLSPYNYTVSYNPEFIAQGNILNDQAYPDMVLIGQANKEVGDIVQEHYEKMTMNTPKICRMSRTQAELTKLSLNCFLTTKIAFANMVGDIAIASGVDPDPVLAAVGNDTRVGPKYLRYGFGYGGPCFPRDNRALGIFARDKGQLALISAASDDSNALHLSFQVEKFIDENPKDTPVVITDVTYKPGTSIIEESQQLKFAVRLAQAGYKVTIRERREVIEKINKQYAQIPFRYEEV